MKISIVYSCIGIFTFWLCFSLILISKLNMADKKFISYSIYIFEAVIISYSLSIFAINSNEIQQQKYQFLWLFLFISALNPFGIISILMLIKKQKNNEIKIKQEISQMIKPEKWFLLWAIYTSIVMMICIVTIPLSIINLINIKKNWKKEKIEIKNLKKIAYFSSDWTLMIASKFAF